MSNGTAPSGGRDGNTWPVASCRVPAGSPFWSHRTNRVSAAVLTTVSATAASSSTAKPGRPRSFAARVCSAPGDRPERWVGGGDERAGVLVGCARDGDGGWGRCGLGGIRSGLRSAASARNSSHDRNIWSRRLLRTVALLLCARALALALCRDRCCFAVPLAPPRPASERRRPAPRAARASRTASQLGRSTGGGGPSLRPTQPRGSPSRARGIDRSPLGIDCRQASGRRQRTPRR